LKEEASQEPDPELIPFVETLTHFCNPVLAGLGWVLLPKVLPELYLTIGSLGLNTFCELEVRKTSSERMNSKFLLITGNCLVI
jgi:hypothetical protein